MSSTSFSSSLMAHSGNANLSDLSCEPWIVDSGASNHMTGSYHILSSYTPCTFPRTITIVNGSFLKIVGTGTVVLSPSLSIKSVFYVPGFSYNLLSISKLTIEQILLLCSTLHLINFRTRYRAEWLGVLRRFLDFTIFLGMFLRQMIIRLLLALLLVFLVVKK